MGLKGLKLNYNLMEDVVGVTNEYPYTMHYDIHDHMDIPWHWHEEVEFNYVVAGEIQYILTDRIVTIGKGEAVFLNSNVMARIDAQKDTVSICHMFHPVLLGGHYKSIYETKYINPVIQNKKVPIVEIKGATENQQRMLHKLRKLEKLQEQSDNELKVRNLLSDIWMDLIGEIHTMPAEELTAVSVHQERLRQMLTFIHNNYEKKLTLEDIAASAAISSRECSRCFQSCMKETPIEYLVNYRIQIAQKMLQTTNASILEIALASGFSNSAYFTKVFKQICGITPKNYRKKI